MLFSVWILEKYNCSRWFVDLPPSPALSQTPCDISFFTFLFFFFTYVMMSVTSYAFVSGTRLDGTSPCFPYLWGWFMVMIRTPSFTPYPPTITISLIQFTVTTLNPWCAQTMVCSLRVLYDLTTSHDLYDLMTLMYSLYSHAGSE